MRLSQREIETLDRAHVSMPGAHLCQRCRQPWPCTVHQLLATITDMRGEIAELLATLDATALTNGIVAREMEVMRQGVLDGLRLTAESREKDR